MNRIYPYFEVDGTRYQFKRNRFLIALLNEIKEDGEATDEQQRQYATLLELKAKVDKLGERKAELETKYFEDFDEGVGALLEKCEVAYKKAAQEYIDYELETKITSTMQEETLKKAERFIVAALQYNDKGEIVRDEKKAENIWCAWVDEVGEQNASAFLVLTVNHISGADEEVEDNDFFTQTRAMAEERANNRRNGLRRVK